MNQRVSVGTIVTNEQIANIGKMIVNKISIQRRVKQNEMGRSIEDKAEMDTRASEK